MSFATTSIAILGSTGSIGKNALKVVSHLQGRVQVAALAAKSNIDLLEQQAIEYQPSLIAVHDPDQAFKLQKRLPGIRVVAGMEGICEAATLPEVETVVAAMVGAAGLIPTAAAIRAKKAIAFANKEVLVAAGAYIVPLAKQHGAILIPVDSEHNAVFQCLRGEEPSSVRKILLTSSGGPFREWSEAQLATATLQDALKHPNFAMGAKITVDSSTMMNKGLEVIEAFWLFGVGKEQIEVLIHPQQKIHSMVEFRDGSILAQMGEPDMLTPIQYAITFPERCQGILPPYDFVKNPRLDFYEPSLNKFICLRLAYDALKAGGTLPCFMNAANEVLVNRFLRGEIAWREIGQKLETLMAAHSNREETSLEGFLATDLEARALACV